MGSPLARVILAIFGGYLIILLFLSIHDWIVEEYPRRPTKPSSSERIQHPFYHEKVARALQLFFRLPEPEKAQLGQSDYQVICMGELHEESTRNFLAEEFFAKFSTDVLLLETTPKNLKRLINRMDAGRDYFPLLNADIMKILRTVKHRNPNIKIWGIEETKEQQKDSNSRDQSIAHNFWERFQTGGLHIILFGALHCTNEPNWLFKNLCNQASLNVKERMLNVQVLSEHQNGPVEAFVYFLDEIGIEKKHFVIPNTNFLHPRIYELFQILNQETLKKYRSLIVLRI
jgi:hypothetical protein